MASKQVADRGKSTRKVSAAAFEHADRTAHAVETKLRPFLKPGETMPDVALLVHLMGRAMDNTYHVLSRAEQAHQQELGDDDGPRAQRDKQSQDLVATLSELREVSAIAFGPAGLERLGLVDPVKRQPDLVLELAQSVLGSLSDPNVELTTTTKGLTVHRDVFVARLTDGIPKLRESLEQVASEQRQAETSLKGKHDAIDTHDSVFSKSAAWLRATFSVAGFEDLAAKVRPSRRRPGRTHEEVTHPAEADNPAADTEN